MNNSIQMISNTLITIYSYYYQQAWEDINNCYSQNDLSQIKL